MQRTLLYFAAFTGMGTVFAATLLVAALVLGATNRADVASPASDSPLPSTEVGFWAFHCHVLTHAEGPDGMFGMVTALVVEE